MIFLLLFERAEILEILQQLQHQHLLLGFLVHVFERFSRLRVDRELLHSRSSRQGCFFSFLGRIRAFGGGLVIWTGGFGGGLRQEAARAID